VFFILIYLPPLLVKENYFSNRTLFALNLAVFILVAETVVSMLKAYKAQFIAVAMISIFLLINAGYNFRREFLYPLTNEYAVLKNFISINYRPEISTIYFI